MSEANQKLPSTASAAVIANTAALNISHLRASFNLRKDAATTKPSKYAALVRRAELEDLKIPQYNVGIGGRSGAAAAAKTANDELRRKLMLDRKRGHEAVKLAGAESSDEDEGRSALGRAKRAKRTAGDKIVPAPVQVGQSVLDKREGGGKEEIESAGGADENKGDDEAQGLKKKKKKNKKKKPATA